MRLFPETGFLWVWSKQTRHGLVKGERVGVRKFHRNSPPLHYLHLLFDHVSYFYKLSHQYKIHLKHFSGDL